MKKKLLGLCFGGFLIFLFASCNESGIGSDDLQINPGEQPILKTTGEESVKITNEEISDISPHKSNESDNMETPSNYINNSDSNKDSEQPSSTN